MRYFAWSASLVLLLAMPPGKTESKGSENIGWDLRKRLVLEPPAGFSNVPASFSSDGRFLATGGTASSLLVWAVESGEIVQRFEHQRLKGMFTPQGTHLIVSRGNQLEFYAPPDFERPSSILDYSAEIPGASIARFLVSSDESMVWIDAYVEGAEPGSGNVYWYDVLSIPDWLPLKTKFMYGRDQSGLPALAPDGILAAVRKYDRIEIWDWRRDLLASVLEFRRVRTDDWAWVDPVPVGVAFSTDGRSVATTHADGTLRLTVLESPERAKIFRFPAGKGAGAVAFPPGGSWMAAAMGGEVERAQLFLYDLDSDSVALTTEGRFGLGTPISISPDGRLIAVAEGLSYMLEPPSGKAVVRYKPAIQVYELIRSHSGAQP